MAQFAQNWEKYTSDPSLLDTVKHCHIDFESVPPNNSRAHQIQFSAEEKQKLSMEVNNLEEAGVIEQCQHEEGEFISHIFGRTKKNGSMHVILNLKS